MKKISRFGDAKAETKKLFVTNIYQWYTMIRKLKKNRESECLLNLFWVAKSLKSYTNGNTQLYHIQWTIACSI